MKKHFLRLISFAMVLIMTASSSSCRLFGIEPDPVPDAVRGELPVLMTDTYQAEEATLQSATVCRAVEDFSGNGYLSAVGSATFTVTADASATYGLTFRYLNGTGASRDVTVKINGEPLTVSFPVTPNAVTWCEKTAVVRLNGGSNTVELNCNEDAQALCFDKIDVCRAYAAEDGTLLGGAKAVASVPGYTGTGFVPLNQEGQGVSFAVNAPVSGAYELTFFYSSRHTDSNPRSVTVRLGDDFSEQVFLSSTRSVKNWATYRHTIQLPAGENTLSVTVENGDNGEINFDGITLKPTNWTYLGGVKEVTGSGTSRVDFVLENAVLRFDSVSENAVRVWVDPNGTFTRKYASAAVVNESVAPQTLCVKEHKKYYSFTTGDLIVRVYKNPLRVVYLDKEYNILTMNDAYGIGWTSDDELICRNVIGKNEHFWGLGETPLSFDRLGTQTALWGNDIVAARNDSAVPATTEDGRWYMNNPVFTSSEGYTVLFDNPSRTVFDFGATESGICSFASLNPYPAGDMIYYFIYGDSIKKQMTSLTDIIGKSFFSPDWGYGNMQSHWGYTQADMERVAQEYRNRNIPLDVIIADIEWYEEYCTPSHWNSKNFPDPDGMIAKLNALNVRFGVIDDPNVTATSADFAAGDAAGYFVKDQNGDTSLVSWPWGGDSGLTDFFNPSARAWWKNLHLQLLQKNISFFWMDMNEPAKYNSGWFFYNDEGKAMGTLADCKNTFAQQQQRTLFEMMTENGNRVLMLTRSGYTGTQRYACPWTGDIQSDYESMRQQLSLGLGLSMSGYHYWTFDIGGSAGGFSDEMVKRWIELGTFMPVTRYHSTSSWEGAREPYEHGAEEVARKYISLRYQLMPYFYSLSADSIIGIGYEGEAGKGTGLPLVRPMVMEFEEDEQTWGLDTQFMSGQSFLVAPVMDIRKSKKVYLPKGNWIDYYTGEIYEGGQTITYPADVDTLPVFVKAGSIIPMREVQQYVGEKPLTELMLDIYPNTKNGTATFVYYEDDGKTDDYQSGEYATTRYTLKDKGNTHTLTAQKREGSYTDIVDRDYLMMFHIGSLGEAQVNGKKLTQYRSLDELKAASEGVALENGIVYVKTHDTAEEITVTVKE